MGASDLSFSFEPIMHDEGTAAQAPCLFPVHDRETSPPVLPDESSAPRKDIFLSESQYL
jgi:hypothetical protein